MLKRLFVKGNEAVAMAAVEAGCRYYFGYPITPQNDIPEYLSRVLPGLNGEFIQAESEIASINMLLGRFRHRCPGDDFLFRPRHLPQAGGDFVHGGLGIARRDCQYLPFRAGTRRDRPFPGGLFPGGQRVEGMADTTSLSLLPHRSRKCMILPCWHLILPTSTGCRPWSWRIR